MTFSTSLMLDPMNILIQVSITTERRATESGLFCIFYSLADLTLLASGNPLMDNQLGCSHQLLALYRSTYCLIQYKQTEFTKP